MACWRTSLTAPEKLKCKQRDGNYRSGVVDQLFTYLTWIEASSYFVNLRHMSTYNFWWICQFLEA